MFPSKFWAGALITPPEVEEWILVFGESRPILASGKYFARPRMH